MMDLMGYFGRNPLSILVALTCSVLFVECSGPGSQKANTKTAGDSSAAADTSATQSVSAQAVSLTYEQRQGRILYTKYCAVCHGVGGKGDGFNAYNLNPKPRDFTDQRAMAGIDDATLLTTVREGGRGVNKSPLMPSWGGRVDRLQMEYLIAYVKALESQH